MKVAPISELNLSASSSSSGLLRADLTAPDTRSLSLTRLPGGLGLQTSVMSVSLSSSINSESHLRDADVAVTGGGAREGPAGSDVAADEVTRAAQGCSTFSMVTSPGSGGARNI